MHCRRLVSLGFVFLLALPGTAQAGMPSVTLTDMARMRVENISFFLAGFLFSAWLIKLVWNYLGRDWTFLPRLSYGKSLALVGLWGLVFVLVLTMISGARELMTPAAWEKQGHTYKLAQGAESSLPTPEQLERTRRDALEKLRAALWQFALRHDGAFPPARTDPAVPADLWKLPDPSGLQYVYFGGKLSQVAVPVAIEPELFGTRLVLFADGTIRLVEEAELTTMLPAAK